MVIRRHPCTPVGVAEIGKKLKVPRSTVGQWRWRSGRDIEPWAKETGRFPQPTRW